MTENVKQDRRTDVSVVVRASTSTGVRDLVGSLDARSDPDLEVQLIVVDDGMSVEDRQRVVQVLGRQPNAVLSAASAVWDQDLTGRWALIVPPGHRLYPAALGHLTRFADEHGLDVVAGRVAGPGIAIAAPFAADALDLDPPAVAAALAAGVVLVAPDHLHSAAHGPVARTDDARVGVLASTPVATPVGGPLTHDPAGAALPVVMVTSAAGHWNHDRYVATLRGTVTPGVEGARTVVLLRQAGTGLSVLLPSTGSVESSGEWSAEVTVAPAEAYGDDPLPLGRWHLDVAVVGTDTACVPVPAPAPDRAAALLESGAVVVASTTTRKWELDVGLVGAALVVDASPEGAKVVESYRGSELCLPLPDVHVATGRVFTGSIVLDTMELPARIEVVDGRAELHACVSGLSGDHQIGTVFGTGRPVPTGLSVRVLPTGEMVVVRSPVPKPAARTGPAVAPSSEAPAPSRPASPSPRPGRAGPTRPVAIRVVRRVGRGLLRSVGRLTR